MLYLKMLKMINQLRRERNLALRDADEQQRRKHIAQKLLDAERTHSVELEMQLHVLGGIVRLIDVQYGPFKELDAWVYEVPPESLS